MRRQLGVALVQVLLVTTIIILLVVQLSLTAADQVKRAQAIQDRSEAALFLHSREAAMLYTMLTEPLYPAPDSNNPYAASWNFHGEPFVIDGLEYSLQDQSGLMRFPFTGVAEFQQLMTVLGLDSTRAREIAAQLGDWLGIGLRPAGPSGGAIMRGGTGGPIQYFEELRFLAGMDDRLYRQLAELMTLYPTPGFNPVTAPAPLLQTRMPSYTLDAILDARRQGQLDQDRLFEIARIQMSEDVIPIIGPGVGIRIAGDFRGVALRRHLLIGILPHRPQPLVLWSRERFASGVPK